MRFSESTKIKHPECREDELYVFNVNIMYSSANFNTLRYKTKRLGQLALSPNGGIVSFLSPVFVKKEELVALGELPE